MREQLLAFIFVAIILMGGVGVIQQGYRQSVTEANPATSIQDESVTIIHNSTLTLSESNKAGVVYNATENVQVEQNGTIYDPGGNWSWQRADGELRIPSGSGLSNNSTANVSYGYSEASNEQQLARDIGFIPTVTLGQPLVLILGLAVLLGAALVFLRMGGY